MAKRDPIIGRWDGHGIRAAARIDRDRMQALPDGMLLEIFPYRPRSDRANRFLHAVLSAAEENSRDTSFGSRPWTSESIKAHVKMTHGWMTGVRVTINGDTMVELKSTADMDAEDFKKFTEQCLEFICTEVCPGLTIEDLRRHGEGEVERVKR